MSTTHSLTIAGKTFELPIRYAAGHTLTENEASALNQTFFENVRNNLAKGVKEGTHDSQEAVTAYANEYDFGIRRSGGSRAPVDPLEAEAVKVAKEKVRDSIKKAGLTNVSAEAIAAKVEEILAHETHGPQLRKIAKQRLDALRKVAEGSEDIFASGLESGPARTRKAEAEAAPAA